MPKRRRQQTVPLRLMSSVTVFLPKAFGGAGSVLPAALIAAAIPHWPESANHVAEMKGPQSIPAHLDHAGTFSGRGASRGASLTGLVAGRTSSLRCGFPISIPVLLPLCTLQ